MALSPQWARALPCARCTRRVTWCCERKRNHEVDALVVDAVEVLGAAPHDCDHGNAALFRAACDAHGRFAVCRLRVHAPLACNNEVGTRNRLGKADCVEHELDAAARCAHGRTQRALRPSHRRHRHPEDWRSRAPPLLRASSHTLPSTARARRAARARCPSAARTYTGLRLSPLSGFVTSVMRTNSVFAMRGSRPEQSMLASVLQADEPTRDGLSRRVEEARAQRLRHPNAAIARGASRRAR